MNNPRHLLVALLFASALAISGCKPAPDALYQPEQDSPKSTQPEGVDVQVLQDTARAAQILSVTNNPSLSAVTDPYKRALLCRHGIGELVDRLHSLAEISDEQRRSADQASRYFQQYLDNAAHTANKSVNDVQDDLEHLALDQTDPGENVRVATACLKALESGTL